MLLDYSPDAIDVQISELLVATADEADEAVDDRVCAVLRLLREKLGMDVVFVSRFEDGRRTFLNVDHAPGADVIAAGQSDPLEESWCQRVVDGRIPEAIPDARPYIAAGKVPAPPFPIGTHLSTPVPARNGEALGTLCCFSFQPKETLHGSDVKRLKYAAQLLADRLAA
ncbi:MAG TPA: GAF domain-containing protein [Ramlibacter sp.]|jgi:GAF domain-containing protein|nr:GAF domain-containing protein [Ramlibacter sp.]